MALTRGSHNMKFGGQATITPVHENFSFYPTVHFDDIVDEDGNVSSESDGLLQRFEPILSLTGRKTGRTLSAYAQDQVHSLQELHSRSGLALR